MAQPGDPWRQPVIGDYGFLSDCASAALVDRDASIDWWCVPRFDSPSVFGRLLDPDAGHWTLHPTDSFESTRRYVEDTLALCTRFVTATGTATVTDTLALEHGARGHEIGLRSPHVLLRTVEGLDGSVHLCSEFAPRMEYGRTRPHVRVTEVGVEARGAPVRLSCSGPVTWNCTDGRAVTDFAVSAGQRSSSGPTTPRPSSRHRRRGVRQQLRAAQVPTTRLRPGSPGPPSTRATTELFRPRSAEARSCCRGSPSNRPVLWSPRRRPLCPRCWAANSTSTTDSPGCAT